MPDLGIGILTKVCQWGGSALILVIENTPFECSGRFVRDSAVDLQVLDSTATLATQRRTHTARPICVDDLADIQGEGPADVTDLVRQCDVDGAERVLHQLGHLGRRR